MARGWNACALLVLAASALLTVSADFLTTDAIQGMIDSNCLYTSNPPAGAPVGTSHGLDHAGCVSCINGFTTPSSTGADGAKVEACFNVCQDPQNQLPGLTTANAAQCVDCLTAANRDICSVCLSLADSSVATDCMAYWGTGGSSITVTDTNAKAAYVWAVGECFKYPTTNNVRDSCLSCLEGYAPATDDAQYFGKCIDAQQQASYIAQGEWDKVNGIYAMCGAAAYTGAVNTGISSSDCYTCMLAVQDAFKDQVQDPILGPQLQRKPYGCAQYCMTEATPLAPATDPTYTDRCTECLAATTPADAWACGNCASITSVNNGKVDCFDCIADDPYKGHTSNFNWACAECSKIADAQLRTLCLQCIRSQPEYGAKPTDPNDTTSDAYKKYLAFIEHTEANICSCVDLTYHAGNTNIHPGAVTIAANRTLDAFELKCFMPQYTYDAAGALVTPSIPWGDIILPYYGADGSIYKGNDATGVLEPCPGCTVDGGPNPAYGGINYAPTTACVECVDSTYRSSAPQFPKQYACSEYCQDPATILPTYTADLPSAFGGTGAVVSEGQDCSSCIQDARVLDPSDCKACIQATNHFTGDFRALRRKQCFALVQSPRVGPAAPATPPGGKRSLLQTTTPSVWPAYAWAASQCVQFTNDIAYGYCASCLTTGCEDPCLCVDKSRNATGTYAPPATCAVQPPPPEGTTCNPQYLWFWTWVNRYCDGNCFTNYALPSPSDDNYGNWKSRTVSEFDYQIQERTRPNQQYCQNPVGGTIGGLPGNPACGFRQIFPTLGGNDPPRHVDSGIHAFTVNSEPIADPSNGVYYDVVGIRIDVSLVQFTPNSQCIADPNNGGECQFFLVVSNAEATGGSAGSDNGNPDPSVKNYSPVVIAWDDSQAATTIGGNDVSGFQNSNGVYQAYNSIAIELDDCRNKLLYTSITPPPANKAMWTGDARNLGNNNVWRMFQVLSPTTPTLPIYHDKK